MGRRPTAAQSIREKKLGDRIYEVCSGVYRLTMPTDFSVGDVNLYFVDGPSPILVDTGVSGDRTIQCLEEALGVINRRLVDVDTLLITHTHVDHAGSIGAIREIANCEIHVHSRAHGYLKDVELWWESNIAWFQDFFVRSGFSPEWVASFRSGRSLMTRYAESCSQLIPVGQGDRLSLNGGQTFVVHEVFGHTTDHVLYVLEESGVVFTADHLLPRISANPTLEPPHPFDEQKAMPLVLYQDSLKRTAELDAEIACPGHGRSFQNIAGRCHEIAEHQMMRCEDIYQLVKAKPGAHRKELSLDIFGKVDASEIYLTLSEINAGLELLLNEGRIRCEMKKDVERYSIL